MLMLLLMMVVMMMMVMRMADLMMIKCMGSEVRRRIGWTKVASG